MTESGNLWVTDTGNARVQEFNSKGEYMQQFGTYGKGELGFFEPTGIAAAPGGMIWIADFANRRVAEYKETPGSSGERFVRNLGGSTGTDFNDPNGLAVDAQGNVFVVDAVNNRIEKFNSSGQYTTQFGTLTSGEGQMKGPTSITIAPTGNLLVADTENSRIAEFQPSGAFIRTFGSLGTGNAQLSGPRGVAFGAGNTLFVADKGNNRVARWSNVDLDPQSGVAKVQIKLDGEVVKEEAPGCPTRDCELAKEWTLKSSQYLDGPHTIKVTTTDGVGLTTTKEIPIVLQPDRTPPSIALSGSMTQQASLGTTRPRYVLNVKASDPGSPLTAFSSAFGSVGSGVGQFNHPADVATDSKGNLWTVDRANNRIEKFNEKGEYLAKCGSTGSGNGQFNAPSAIAIDSESNIWVVDTGNNRIEKFNEKGEYLTQFGSKGSGNGQFSEPLGIAINGQSANVIFVVDRGNNRIERFTKAGVFVGAAGSSGSGDMQFIEPSSIAIGPAFGEATYTLLVTDTGNNRVQRFSPAGVFTEKFGSKGPGAGQFESPEGISVDSKGNVWVGDQKNGRVEAFNERGEYLTQFGSKGAGAKQFSFSYPVGVESDSKGNLWISDTNNNRIQKWAVTEGTSSGTASTTIKVDGKVVDSTSPGCPAGGCSISREWILNSSSTTTGQHTAEVIATDVAGLTITKSQTFSIAKDTTAPQITANASLYTAPEGWVEQQPYPYTASATDPGGYGNTSLVLKIDGKSVKTASQSCPDGACEETLSGSIDMAGYQGGAHPAELVATDGAGNTAKKAWTINVDPKGNVSTSEATATLKAVDTTSPVNTVGPSEGEEEYEGTAPNLGVAQVAGGIKTVGSYVTGEIDPEPGGSITLQILEDGSYASPCGEATESEPATEENEDEDPCLAPAEIENENSGDELTPLIITPVGVIGGATENNVVGEAIAIGANTSNHVDTIIRPLFDGSMLFEDIRDPSGPETFSWEIELSDEMELKQIDDRHAAVFFEGGHVACGIVAEPAHDAIGSAVPTSLSVSEDNVITLVVHHHASSPAGGSFVYPIIAGSGWEGGFHTIEVELPPEQQEENEAEESGGGEISFPIPQGKMYLSGGPISVGAPEPYIAGGGKYNSKRHFFNPACVKFYGFGDFPTGSGPYIECQNSEHIYARGYQSGFFHYSGGTEVWWEGDRESAVNCVREFAIGAWRMEEKGCHFAGLNHQIGSRNSPPHIVATQNWRVWNHLHVFGSTAICLEVHTDLFANGNIKRLPPKAGGVYIGENDACNWSD